MVSMIIIDSNIWIFAEIINSPEHNAAVKGYESFMKNDAVAINAVIASEVFHKLSKLFDQDIAYDRVNNILQNPSIEWLDIERNTAMRAIKLASKSKLRINDALIAEQALELNAKVFTEDKDFKRVKGLTLETLR